MLLCGVWMGLMKQVHIYMRGGWEHGGIDIVKQAMDK